MKLEISLFRFDSNSDYLPFYTKHFLKIKDEKNLLDVLNTINKNSKFGYINCNEFDLVVNGVYLKASITLSELIKNFGKDLTIEPISIRRAYNDLLIDEKDFNEKISILDEFLNDESKKQYKKLKLYYYASNTLNFKTDYIGDALLLISQDLIENSNTNTKNKILSRLLKIEISAQYHTSLKNRIYNLDPSIEEKIQKLQKTLQYFEETEKQNYRINTSLKLDFGQFQDNYEIKHDFKNFNIAYYSSNAENKYEVLVNKLNANMLKLDSLKLDLAKNTFNINPNITYYVACTILLDAFDNNADFLLVNSIEDFYIFDYNRKQFEQICGRDVLLPVIYINELQQLASGEHKTVKKTLIKHQINPKII